MKKASNKKEAVQVVGGNKKPSEKQLRDLGFSKEEVVSMQKPSITVTTTTIKEDSWTIERPNDVKHIESGLNDGSFFILPIDSDGDQAIVMSCSNIGGTPTLMARLKHNGGSNSCDIKYKVE